MYSVSELILRGELFKMYIFLSQLYFVFASCIGNLFSLSLFHFLHMYSTFKIHVYIHTLYSICHDFAKLVREDVMRLVRM